MNAVVQQNEAADFRGQFKKMESEISVALPPHIPTERFMRVVLTAVNANPDLLNADRRSLFESAMKSAQDGLLPDGRDGAFVVFNTNQRRKVNGQWVDNWIKKVQWMPMIGGILKKVRNSGELASIDAQLVHQNDKFTYRLGVEEVPIHEPDWFGDRGEIVGVYAVATLKDKSRITEIMSRRQVEEVRNVSKAKDSGPWVSWWGEMARKTVLRRLTKRLPMSSDLDDLIRRDDELYDLKKGNAPSLPPAQTFTPIENPLSDDAPQIEDRTSAGEAPADQSTGIIEGEGANTEGDATEQPSNDALIAEARSVSLEGRRKFDPWFNALTAEQAEVLAPHMPSLMKAAKDSDQRTKPSA